MTEGKEINIYPLYPFTNNISSRFEIIYYESSISIIIMIILIISSKKVITIMKSVISNHLHKL